MPPTLTKMDPELIQREVSVARKQLADRAATKLGYDKLQKVLEPKPLLASLRSIGITPFDAKEVERYKKGKEHVGMWSNTKAFIAFLCALPILGYLCVYFGSRSANFPDRSVGNFAMCIACFICGAAFCITAIVLGMTKDAIGTGNRTTRKWASTTTQSFQGIIAEHALDTAVQIEELPMKPSLRIDYLTESKEREPVPIRDPDPFLVAYVGSEEYYVDVWDEKKYERFI